MPIPLDFISRGFTENTEFKVIKPDGPFSVGDMVVINPDESEEWSVGWAWFKDKFGNTYDLYYDPSSIRCELEVVEDTN